MLYSQAEKYECFNSLKTPVTDCNVRFIHYLKSGAKGLNCDTTLFKFT